MSQRISRDQIVIAALSGLQSAESGVLVSCLISYLSTLGLNYIETGIFLGLVSLSHIALQLATQTVRPGPGKRRAAIRSLLLVMVLTSAALATSSRYSVVFTASVLGILPISSTGLEPLKRTLNCAMTACSSNINSDLLVARTYTYDVLAWGVGAVIAGRIETFYDCALVGYQLILKVYCFITIASFALSMALSCNIEDCPQEEEEEEADSELESELTSEPESEPEPGAEPQSESESEPEPLNGEQTPDLGPDLESQAESPPNIRGLKLLILYLFLVVKELSTSFLPPVWQTEYLKRFCHASPLGASVALAVTRALLCFAPLFSIVCLRLTSPLRLVFLFSFLAGLACSVIPLGTSKVSAAVALACFALLNVANAIPTTFSFLRDMPHLTRQLTFTIFFSTKAFTVLGSVLMGLAAYYNRFSDLFFAIGGSQVAVTSLAAKSLL